MHNCPVVAVINDLNVELSSKSIVLSEHNCASVDTGMLWFHTQLFERVCSWCALMKSWGVHTILLHFLP